MKTNILILFALTPCAHVPVEAGNRGVIDEPEGFANVRAGESDDAAVIGTLKAGEPFQFQCKKEAEWCQVTLHSGKTGWMHRSRIPV